MSSTSIFNLSDSFYKSPVSKLALFGSVFGYLFMSFPARKYLPLLSSNYRTLFIDDQIWRLPLSTLIYTDARYLFLSIILVLSFKKFERRYGTRKFVSRVIVAWIISVLLEITLIYCSVRYRWFDLETFPTGPLSAVISFLIPYYVEVPRIPRMSILGIPITGKSIVYITVLQIASSSFEAFLLVLIGLISGTIIQLNVLYLQNYIVIPKQVGLYTSRLFGDAFDVEPPNLPAVYGATSELQRRQEEDRIEQMMMAELQQHSLLQGQNVNGRTPSAREAVEGITPSEELLNQLVDMGFNRQRAADALRVSRNDLINATNYLLIPRP